MKNGEFPRWSAPLIGMGIGILISFRAGRRQNAEFSIQWVVIGAVLGGLGGCLVFLLDAPKPDDEFFDDEDDELDDVEFEDEGNRFAKPRQMRESYNPGSIVGRLFAVLSVPLFFLPVLGLLWGIVAFVMNRDVDAWPRRVSKIGLGMTVGMHAFYLFMMVAKK